MSQASSLVRMHINKEKVEVFLVTREMCLMHKSPVHCHAYLAQGSPLSNIMIAVSTFASLFNIVTSARLYTTL